MTPVVLKRLLLNAARGCGSAGGHRVRRPFAAQEGVLQHPPGPAQNQCRFRLDIRGNLFQRAASTAQLPEGVGVTVPGVFRAVGVRHCRMWLASTVGWVGIGLGNHRALFQP